MEISLRKTSHVKGTNSVCHVGTRWPSVSSDATRDLRGAARHSTLVGSKLTGSRFSMAGCGRSSAPMPSQQQQPIANDHIPLAFLLGSRAKHYAAPKKASHSRDTHHSSSLASTSITNSSAASSRRSPTQQQRRRDNVELFAPEKHPREREEEARRVLAQALLGGPQNPDSTKKISSSIVSTTTLSPTGVLRENKNQVLHQVLELRQLEYEQSEDDCEPQRRRRNGLQTAIDDFEDDAQAKSFHGYQRVDQQASFLDVSGNASRIPVLSNLKAKEMYQRVMKKQSQTRAKRVDELHSFLQNQRQYTKQQLASLSSNPKSHNQVARVDLGVDDANHPEVHAGGPVVSTTTNVVAAVRKQQEQEQVLLHERIQEKKLVTQLTRQQKLAFHQQQKRTLGRVKGVKRPSFLATLQLDTSASTGGDTMATGDAAGPCLIGDDSFRQETVELRLHRKNQEESELEREGERKLQQLQRDTFLQSEGGLHFGGGFQSKSNKKIPAITATSAKRTSHSIGGDVAIEAMSHELQELLTCGAVAAKQER